MLSPHPRLENNSKNSQRMWKQGGGTLLCSHYAHFCSRYMIKNTIVKVFRRVWFSLKNSFTTLVIDLPVREINVRLLLNGCLVQPVGTGHQELERFRKEESGYYGARRVRWAEYGTRRKPVPDLRMRCRA